MLSFTLLDSRRILNLFTALVLLLSVAFDVMAMDAQQIMEKADAIQRRAADGTLTRSKMSTCAFGKKAKQVVCTETPRVKVIESVTRQFGPELKDSKNISIVLEPASERGIGMLTYSYDDVNRDTESWLYLSALGKVKRMASGAGEEREPVSVFGTEFTTEDTETGKIDEYTYEILQEGAYGGRQVWVIEATPRPLRYAKTNYSKIRYWVDKDRFVILKLQNYDRRGKPFKQIIFTDFQKINGLWLSRDATLFNLQGRRLTHMKTEAIAMNVNVDDEFLTQRTLTDFAFREKHLEQLRRHFE